MGEVQQIGGAGNRADMEEGAAIRDSVWTTFGNHPSSITEIPTVAAATGGAAIPCGPPPPQPGLASGQGAIRPQWVAAQPHETADQPPPQSAAAGASHGLSFIEWGGILGILGCPILGCPRGPGTPINQGHIQWESGETSILPEPGVGTPGSIKTGIHG